jgi:hypothetical protein
LLLRGSPYSPRFAASYAQRSEQEASVNNALLGGMRSENLHEFIEGVTLTRKESHFGLYTLFLQDPPIQADNVSVA